MRFDRSSALAGALVSALAFSLAGILWPTAAPLGAQSTPMDAALSELRRDLHSVESAAARAQLIAVAYQIDNFGLHALDESVQAGQIPSGALGRVRRARIAAAAVAWPESVQETAHDLNKHLVDLESALRDEDADAAKDPAKGAHRAGHDLSDKVYSWLGQGQTSGESHADEDVH